MKFDSVDRFIVGTVGEPGERAFYLQVRQAGRLATVAVEKAQVVALTSRLEMLISQIRKNGQTPPATPRDDNPLEQPIDADFVVGAIAIAWDDDSNTLSIELSDIVEISDGNNWNLTISVEMAVSFVHRAKAVISAGRLPCPLCGLAIDPHGHLCPRANGYRR